MDRLELIPGDVRGGGNITTLKDDFKTDENTNVYGIHLGEESTFVNGKLMTVYNSRLTTYHSSVADKWALTFTAPRVVSPGDTVTVNFTALCGDDAVGSTEARLVLRSINGETVFWEDTMVISSGSGSFSVTVPSVDDVFCEWVLFISHYFYQNASCHRSVIVADVSDVSFDVFGDNPVIQVGDTCNVVGVLTGTIGDDVIGIPGQTVNFYELWTPGLRVSAPKVIQSGDNIDIKAQLIDSVDGSLVRESGHTVNVYMDDAPVPVPTRLDVNFDKTILSYADGDSAYVVVGVYDQYGDAMPNQIVSVSINEGAPFDLETDEYGQGYFSYVSQGAGDVVFTVECGNLQETYEIEDCTYYNSGTITGSQTLNIPNIPVNFKATVTIKRTAQTDALSWLNIGTDANNCFFFGQVGVDSVGIFKKVNGTNTVLQAEYGVIQINNDYPMEFTYNDGTLTLKVGGKTLNGSFTETNRNYVSTNIGANNSMKELKIKPL